MPKHATCWKNTRHTLTSMQCLSRLSRVLLCRAGPSLVGALGEIRIRCPLRADYGPTFTQRKEVTDPPCVHRKGLTCTSQKLLIFHWGDTATRAVIGPLTKTIKVHDYVEASAGSFLLLFNLGFIKSVRDEPGPKDQHTSLWARLFSIH